MGSGDAQLPKGAGAGRHGRSKPQDTTRAAPYFGDSKTATFSDEGRWYLRWPFDIWMCMYPSLSLPFFVLVCTRGRCSRRHPAVRSEVMRSGLAGSWGMFRLPSTPIAAV